MKRIVVALLLIAALAGPAFGQDVGGTWINPNQPFFTSPSGTKLALPTSIMAYSSGGLIMDEIDLIVRAPATIGSFDGYSLWTAYGNYEFWNNAVNTFGVESGTAINPLNPAVIAANTVGKYQFGLAMPFIMDMRLGIVGGWEDVRTGNLAGGLSKSTTDTTTTADADDDNIIDSTTTVAGLEDDISTLSNTSIIAATDIGLLGVSLYYFQSGTTRSIGEETVTTRTPGADWTNADYDSSETVYKGSGALSTTKNGKIAGWSSASDIVFGSVVQLPLNLGGFELPLAANLGLYLGKGTLGQIPYYSSVTTQYWNGTTSVAGINTTMTALDTEFGDYIPATVYLDPTNSHNSTTAIDLYLGADPRLTINDTVSLKAKAGLGYRLALNDTSTTEKASSSITEWTGTASDLSTWTYSFTDTSIGGYTQNLISLNLGGIFEFISTDERLTIGIGAFGKPEFAFKANKTGVSETITSRSWNDPAVVNEATAATALTDIGPALTGTGVEGTITTTTRSTPEADEKSGTTTIGGSLALPVNLSLKLFEGKIILGGGYVIERSMSTTYTYSTTVTDPDTDISTTMIQTTDGTTVSTVPALSADRVVTTTSSWGTIVDSQWTGTMGLGVRWLAMDNMTVDATLQSVKAALDALDVFNTAGANLGTFINSLALSVTFHF